MAMNLDQLILVVDEEPQVRWLIRTILSKHGFRCIEAADGSSALSTLCSLDGAVSLVVTDFSISGLDGAEIALRVKRQFPRVPVLLMSGDTKVLTYLAGDGFLAKPFTPEALREAVYSLTGDRVAAG